MSGEPKAAAAGEGSGWPEGQCHHPDVTSLDFYKEACLKGW